MPDYVVGPVGNGQYAYSIHGKMSVHRYANRASAEYNAQRPQTKRWDGYLEPDQTAENRAEARATRRLKSIHDLLERFDWESDDHQYALKIIERLADVS